MYMCDSRVGSLNHYVRLLFSGIIGFSIFSLEVSNLFLAFASASHGSAQVLVFQRPIRSPPNLIS